MRRFLTAIFVLVIVVTLVGAWWFLRGNAPAPAPVDDSLRIALSSDPFPLVVGRDSLIVTLTKAGVPVDGATVRIEANRSMEGQLPITAVTRASEDGVYTLPLFWSANARWVIDVDAEANGETVHDQFTVFVFSVPEQNSSGLATYASTKAIDEARANNVDEFWIVIPQGTAAEIREGHGDDVMPQEIRLQVGGRNTLVLQNNDLEDHTIGPFFVRAGETLRQTFDTPAVYEGVCSVRHDAVVSIIVE